MMVNGKKMNLADKENLIDLIEELNLDADKIVVEIDKEIIPREQFDDYQLKESNTVEVISFVGGGWRLILK